MIDPLNGITLMAISEQAGRNMLHYFAGRLYLGKKVFVGIVIISALGSSRISAQLLKASDPMPSFEVATIKPSHSSRSLGQVRNSLGVFSCNGITVRTLIDIALNARTSGGPSWIESTRYDIDAKAEDSVIEKLKDLPRVQQQEQNRLMLQSLLASRFNLKLKHEIKVAPVYRLVVAKSGTKLRRTNGMTSVPPFEQENGKLVVHGMPIAFLLRVLAIQPELGGREIIDQTGLKEKYDFTLQWEPEEQEMSMLYPAESNTPQFNGTSSADSSEASLFTAIREQLGLKLESTKAPVQVIVIDHIERPSEN